MRYCNLIYGRLLVRLTSIGLIAAATIGTTGIALSADLPAKAPAYAPLLRHLTIGPVLMWAAILVMVGAVIRSISLLQSSPRGPCHSRSQIIRAASLVASSMAPTGNSIASSWAGIQISPSAILGPRKRF